MTAEYILGDVMQGKKAHVSNRFPKQEDYDN